jgi:hypothetical protein
MRQPTTKHGTWLSEPAKFVGLSNRFGSVEFPLRVESHRSFGYFGLPVDGDRCSASE